MDFQIERQLDAPIERVWAAWTQAKDLEAWYSPGPVNWTVDELDVRPGGAYRMHMKMPDGERVSEGSFSVVHEPTRLVQGPTNGSMTIETLLESVDGGTHMTVVMAGLPAEQHDMMEAAWTGGFGKLEKLLS